jgi:periplasmic protein TonB
MASPAKIAEFLPETLPEDFGEWDDEASLPARPARLAGSEYGPVSVPRPVTQPAGLPRILTGPENRRQAVSPLMVQKAATIIAADRILAPAFRTNTAERLAPKPARKKWPILAGASSALVVILAAVMISVFNDRTAQPIRAVPAPLPPVSQPEQPQNAAPVQSPSALAAPAPSQPTVAAKNAQSSTSRPTAPVQQIEDPGPSEAQAQMMNNQLRAPARIHLAQIAPPSSGFAAISMGGSANNAIGTVLPGAQQPRVQAALPKILNVSSAVAFALLIRRTPPIYPRIAKDSRVSGTVVLRAQVSKSGNVEDVRVVSGPEMLRTAAANAVRTWRFKPYEVDNQPTVFETTINVAFSLSD